MKNYLIITLLIFTAISCSDKSEVIDLSDQIVSLSKKKEFKKIYPLLSSNDRDAISADSFYVDCYKYYERLNSMGTMKILNTEFEKLPDETYAVHKTIEFPDYALIKKLKKEDEELKNVIIRMGKSNSIPTTIDTISLKFVKEDDGIKYHIGYAEQKKYQNILKKKREEYLKDKVEIKVDRLELNYYYSTDYKQAVVYADIKNTSDCKINSVSCELIVDSLHYKGPYSGYLYFSVDLDTNGSQKDEAYLTELVKDELFSKYYPETTQFNSERLSIKLSDIYFDGKCQEEENTLYKNALKESGFENNSMGFVSTVAALLE